ncbi:hypothetical protein DCAR_0933353 [Daucus carota subsp. sativus]|uniref:Uncharacterized protein n=2 Tax=Daucus carota subsp. sativus TaxID=79200 RepID=A0AAF0XV05_DAUCS|nr:hypothetical protein DCAR_0933353 [Daucus carota subsp. sativus]
MIQSPNTEAEEFDFSSTDFGFGFNGHSQVPADLLFDGGKIRPLKLLPRSEFQYNIFQHNVATYSPTSPPSPKRMLSKGAALVAPQHKKTLCSPETKEEPILVNQSTFSGSDVLTSSSSSSIWSRRWKLTDLFTSLSYSTDKNVTKDDSASILRSHKKDSNEWSFRSESSSKSGSSRGGGCRRRGRVSAHEWHYKQNRAAAEEMRRKTFLPYKKSLLGCMDVDPSGVLDFSRGHGVEITC